MPQAIVLAALLSASPTPAPPILPGDNLVVQGIPPIPAEIAERAARYSAFRSAAFASWHPQRHEMLIVTRMAEAYQAHHVAAPGGNRRQLTFFNDRTTEVSFPPRGDGSFFVFGKDRGGDEFTQLYRHDLRSGEATLLTDGGRSQNRDLVWSHSGERLAYGSTRRNGRDRDVYVMDPRNPKTDRLVFQVEGGGWSVQDWSPDDRSLLVREFISDRESHLWLVDVASGSKTLLTPKGGETAAYDGAEFDPSGNTIYVATDRGSEFRQLARLDRASGRLTPLNTAIPWDVEALSLSPDGRTLAFVTNEDGVDKLRLLDTATDKERPAPALGSGVVVPPSSFRAPALEWHPDGTRLGFSFASARAAQDAFSLDLATGKVDRWTESETGGFDASTFGDAELVRWKSFDGRSISGFLYPPSARFTGKRPVLIDIHGGPAAQARPRLQGERTFLLNELGVAVIAPNVRGSSGYGKTFLQLDDGMKREDSVKDVGALLDWIRTRPELDPERVMVTGASYGGYMSLAVGVHYGDRVRCIQDVVGISHFTNFLERTEAYRRDLRRVEYGDEREPTMRAFFERIAPLNRADRITKPLFVVQGANDPRVPMNESEQIVRTVQKQGTPVWYLLARDEGHGFAKKRNQDFLMYATMLFMQTYLLN